MQLIKTSVNYVTASMTSLIGMGTAATTENEITFSWGVLFGAIGAIGVVVQMINSTRSTNSILRTEAMTKNVIEETDQDI